MTESEEEQRSAEPADGSTEPGPLTRERKLFLGGLRGGILGALISGLLAWGLVSATTQQGADFRGWLAITMALMAVPVGLLVGGVIGIVMADLKQKK